jgi:hypothetical protein
MTAKAVISLTTGLEDPEKVTVAFLVAVGAAESGRPTLTCVPRNLARLEVPVAGLSWGNGRVAGRGACL